jgi:hypothetical protein
LPYSQKTGPGAPLPSFRQVGLVIAFQSENWTWCSRSKKGKNDLKKIEKSEEISCFEVLDVF